jgi:hypothetical protein
LDLILPVFLLLLPATAWSGVTTIQVSDRSPGIEILDRKSDGLSFRITVGELTALDVETKAGAFSRLMLPGFGQSRDIGKPALPMVNRLFEIPYGADVSVQIHSFETKEIQLSDFGVGRPLMPAQPSVFKDQNLEQLAFHFDEATYRRNEDYGREVARTVDAGQMRGVRVGRLEVAPVRYNPKSGTITVQENIELTITFRGSDPRGESNLKRSTYSPFFESVYQRLAGYKGPHDDHPDLLTLPVTYVIVSDRTFEAQLGPFIEWKTEQGFRVIEAYTDDPQVGSTPEDIQTYLHDLYNSGTPEIPAPTFVLFVGDASQVPSFTINGYTDLPYCDVTGDKIPEMYYGRFSANSTAELQPQIDKTLEYEKYEMPDPSYLGEAVMIAGVDAWHGELEANGQINYATTQYFNAAHGILSHTYLYPESGDQDAAIVQDVSDGCGFVNYTAHGATTYWTNPRFNITNIYDLLNVHEYPFVIGNCCLTSSYQLAECFAEAWLRAEDAGAIGYVGASNSTLWDEDYDWAVGNGPEVGAGPTYEETGLGVFDGMFHDHGEDFGKWYVVADATIFCGNLAVLESGSTYSDYYWYVYNLMGDPSLIPYLGEPDANTVVLPGTIHPAATEVIVSAEPKSYVGITKDGSLVGSGVVGTSGSASIPVSGQGYSGNVQVVVTCQNKIPYTGLIPVTSEGTACLTLSSEEMDFGWVVQGTHPSNPAMLWNVCPVEQNWSVADKPSWIETVPSSGTLTPAPAMKSITVTADVDGLGSKSSHDGYVVFTSEDGACSLHVYVEVMPSDLLDAPIPTSPADLSEVATLTPTLVVEHSAPPTKDGLWIRFEIDSTSTFSSSLRQLSDTVAVTDPTTEWQTAELQENTEWFWRSWAEDTYFAGDTTGVSSFYVNVANECPESFSLVAPRHDSTLTTRQPTFEWELTQDYDPLDSLTYVVFVETQGVWDSLAVGAASQIQWPELLDDNTVFHWKVGADDGRGCRTWSSDWTFAVATGGDCPVPFELVRPADDSVLVEQQPRFVWESAVGGGIPGSVTYTLYLEAGGVWDSVSVDTATQVQWPEDLADNEVYGWKVAAHKQSGCQIWSSERAFAVDLVNECPEPSDPIYPPPDTTIANRSPLFQWEPSLDPDPLDELTYILYVGTGGAWDSVSVGTAAQMQWPDSLDDNTVYEWKVGVDDMGSCRQWSGEWAFAVNQENEPPLPLSLISPDSVGVSSSLRPVFTWNPATDPDPGDEINYWIWFSQDSLFLDFCKDDSAWVGTATQYTPDQDLLDNTIYFWQVLARDEQGELTVSPTWKFAADTAPPAFTFVLLQNPFLDRYLDFYAVPSESLYADPVVGLRWSDFDVVAPMDPLDTSVPIYHVDVQVPAEVCGTAQVTGYDKAYVMGVDSLAFCSLFIEKGSPGRILSPDGRAELIFTEASAGKDLFVTAVPRVASDLLPLTKVLDAALAPGDLLWSLETGQRTGIGNAVSFSPTRERLATRATLRFRYSPDELGGQPEWKLGIYRLGPDGWSPVEDARVDGRWSMSAQIRELGIYQLQLDPNRTRPAPRSFALRSSYPNPFNPSTTIEYQVASEARVAVRVYGVDGRLVRELVNGVKPAGLYSTVWDGADNEGRPVASGVYFCHMTAPGFVGTQRLVLLK